MNIKVYDNLVPMTVRNKIYDYVIASNYRIGWNDSSQLEKLHYRSLHCPITIEEFIASGLSEIHKKPEIQQEISDYGFYMCVVNLSTSNDVNFTHVHPSEWKVVLYYANLEWCSEFYGETVFFNDADDEIIKTIRYKPGRIVIFDGNIPHSIRPQSIVGPQFRFTVAVIYRK